MEPLQEPDRSLIWIALLVLGFATLSPLAMGPSTRAEARAERTPESQAPAPSLEVSELDPYGPLIELFQRRDIAKALEDPQALLPTKVEYVVVTVADPVESSLDFELDRTLDAIAHALSSDGWVRDRFMLPWSRYMPDQRNDGRGRDQYIPDADRVWRRVPGVMLFRKGFDLRVVLLVGETPTWGVHPDAMSYALDMASVSTKQTAPIRVLGPFFSGSVPSLRRSLDRFACRQACRDIRFNIVTGSATDSRNAELLRAFQGPDAARCHALLGEERPSCDPSRPRPGDFIEYRAAIMDDDELLGSYYSWLNAKMGVETSALGSADVLKSVVLLAEDFTAYGGVATTTPGPVPRLTVRFPYRISRIRAAYERQRQALTTSTPPAPQKTLELSLEDVQDPLEAPGAFSARSLYSDELVLRQDIDVSCRPHAEQHGGVAPLRFLGILATNTSDALFVGRHARIFCPTPRLFFVGSDVLLTHPDYHSALGGALVVSQYPLAHPVVRDCACEPSREPAASRDLELFASSVSQGVFNAIQMLFDSPAKMRGLGECEVAGPLPPACFLGDCTRRIPRAWITVIGNGRVVPVARIPADGEAVRWTVDRDEAFRVLTWATAVVSAWIAAVSLLVFFVRARRFHPRDEPGHTLARLRNVLSACVRRLSYMYEPFGADEPSDGPFVGRERSKIVNLGLLFDMLLLIVPVTAVLFLMRVALEPASSGNLCTGTSSDPRDIAAMRSVLTAMLAVLAGIGVAVPLQVAVARLAKTSGRGVGRAVATAAPLLAGVSMAIGVVGCQPWACYARHLGKVPHLLLADRIGHLGSGVNPLIPLLLLAVALVACGHHALRRLHALELCCCDPLSTNTLGDKDPFRVGLSHLQDELIQALRTPAGSWVGLVITGLFALVLGTCWIRPAMRSVEGWVFDAAVNAMVVVLLFMVFGAAASALREWRWLRSMLHRYASLPYADAFNRLPKELVRRFEGLLFARLPFAHEMMTPVTQLRALDSLAKASPPSLMCSRPDVQRDVARALGRIQELEREIASAEAMLPPRDRLGVPRRVRDLLEDIAEKLVSLLESHRPDPTSGADPFIRLAEEIVCGQAAMFVFFVQMQIRRLLMQLTTAVVLLLAVFVSYPFENHRRLLETAWLLVLGAMGLCLWIIVTMERDEVLSRIRQTPAGRVTWNAVFVGRLLKYGLLPLLTLVATTFPEIGMGLLALFEPLLRRQAG